MARKNKWKTKVGRDCVSLDTALARWLGERLTFLAKHSNGVPQQFIEVRGIADTDMAHDQWRKEMREAGEVLSKYGKVYDLDTVEEAQAVTVKAVEAMEWVAEWFLGLWD